MPLYEYYCPDCGQKFEILSKADRSSEKVPCSSCGAEAERVFSTFASFSRDASGATRTLGTSCSGCSSTNCQSCGR